MARVIWDDDVRGGFFLYISNDILSLVFIIRMSRKFNLFPSSCSSVKVRLGVIPLNDLRTCLTSVTFSL